MRAVFPTAQVRSRAWRSTAALSAGVLGAGLVLAACGSSSSNSSTSTSAAASSGSGTSTSSSAAPSSSTAATGGSTGKSVGISLILKELSNPYFVAMAADAKAEAAKDNVKLTIAAGTADTDTSTQIQAIQNAIARGDKGILITTDGDAVNTALKQAKAAGIFVIALDTAPNPPSVADLTFATDNTAAGKLDGQYAAAKLAGKKAIIAMLDLSNTQVISVDIDRDHGFLEGMGINPGSTTQNGKEAKTGNYTGGKGGQYQVVCHNPTGGDEADGRTAMENCLSANPNINVVYAINEPSGRGAYDALKAAGKTSGVDIYAIDGSCLGVANVKSGEFTADALQYPGKMALLGVDAIATLVRTGKPPKASAGLSFFNTGTNLVAGTTLTGVTSTTPAAAGSLCWGSASGS